MSNALVDDLNERAIQMHLQRIVDAFVSSAHSAGTFYQTKVTEARDLTSRLANEARDEDREVVYGFESKPARARDFAAKMGLQLRRRQYCGPQMRLGAPAFWTFSSLNFGGIERRRFFGLVRSRSSEIDLLDTHPCHDLDVRLSDTTLSRVTLGALPRFVLRYPIRDGTSR